MDQLLPYATHCLSPESSASLSAASSISPPRAQLMIRTPRLVFARFSFDRMFRVWSVNGVCRVMKSAFASKVSRSAFRSEEHTSELQSLMRISYSVFCLKKKQKQMFNH